MDEMVGDAELAHHGLAARGNLEDGRAENGGDQLGDRLEAPAQQLFHGRVSVRHAAVGHEQHHAVAERGQN